VNTKAFLFTAFLFVLLSLAPARSVYSLTLISLPNRAGLPYPQEGYEGTIFLKEVSITLDVVSTWGSLTGYPPWHSVTISHKAIYVFENIGASTSLRVNIPLWDSPSRHSTFEIDGQTVNYTSVEIVLGNEPGSGVIMRIYTLTMEFPDQCRRTLEIEAEQFGAAPSEAQYIYHMENASRWMKPIEELSLVSNLTGGLFTNFTINPTILKEGGATWNLTNLTPSRDLIIEWKIKPMPDLQPPVPPFIAYIVFLAATALMIGLLTKYSSTRLVPSYSGPELYEQLLLAYTQFYGARSGEALENKVRSLTKQGLSREEVIHKIAEKEGLIKKE